MVGFFDFFCLPKKKVKQQEENIRICNEHNK